MSSPVLYDDPDFEAEMEHLMALPLAQKEAALARMVALFNTIVNCPYQLHISALTRFCSRQDSVKNRGARSAARSFVTVVLFRRIGALVLWTGSLIERRFAAIEYAGLWQIGYTNAA